jgi:hypothetical protein
MSPYYPGNDDWGFRNPNVPDRCDILTIGDSNTYGFATTQEFTWPRQLERLAECSTYNMSCGGYGLCQYEVLLQRGLRLGPRHIVVALSVSNDFVDTYDVIYRQKSDCPALRLKAHDASVQASFRLADKTTPFVPTGIAVEREDVTVGAMRRWLAANSSLYAIARGIRSAIAGNQYYSPLREDDPPQDAYRTCLNRPGRWAYDVGQVRTVFLAPSTYHRATDLTDPRIQEGKRIAESILLSMRDAVEKSGARLVVVLIPTKLMAYRGRLMHSSTSEAQQALAATECERSLTESIEEFLAVHSISFVNVTPAIQRHIEDGDPLYPDSDDNHPTRAGYEVIAKAVLPLVSDR